MLPVPSIKFFPKIAQENLDAGWSALSAKLDSIISAIQTDVLKFDYILDPAKCPSVLLPELNFILNAGVTNSDTDRQQRQKISMAIENHKKRTFWTGGLKDQLDIITGYSAALYTVIDSDDAIWLARQASDPDYYWSTWQPADGVDANLGIAWASLDYPVSPVIKGYVMIDLHYGVHTPVLSAGDIAHIKAVLTNDYFAAYFIFYLGYTDTAGAFVVYSGGVL